MNKHCRKCDNKFVASGPSVVYCQTCNELRKRKTVANGVQQVPCRINFVQYRVLVRHEGRLNDLGYYPTQEAAEQVVKEFREVNPKVSQGQWAKDNLKTSGLGYFYANRQRVKQERKSCNRCEKNLLDASSYEWCVHHIDHDRTNNVDSNFELLCKRCHQLEHCKHDKVTGQYTQGSTTISQESTAK